MTRGKKRKASTVVTGTDGSSTVATTVLDGAAEGLDGEDALLCSMSELNPKKLQPTMAPGALSGTMITDRQKSAHQETKSASIALLQSVMSKADDAMQGRMRMRVIQAGLQNADNPTASFIGSDGQEYSDLRSIFNSFSGISQCSSCSQNMKGVS